MQSGSLQNVVEFGQQVPAESALVVDSSVQAVSEQRCEFKFRSLTIRTPQRRVQLPPFGQGWFDTVYLDSNLRIARDIRGDTLITTRSTLPLDTWLD